MQPEDTAVAVVLQVRWPLWPAREVRTVCDTLRAATHRAHEPMTTPRTPHTTQPPWPKRARWPRKPAWRRPAATQAKHNTRRSQVMRHEARAKRLRHTHLKNETKLTPNAW